MTASRPTVVLREAELEDCQPTVELLARHGLVVPTEPEVARRTWEWLWIRNPAVVSGRSSPPLGWVLEREDEIVGFFGNIPRLYHCDGQDLLVSVGTSWAVDPAFRARTRALCAAYFEQNGVELLLATTANRSAGRMLVKFSAEPMPQKSYEQVLYWVLDANGFVSSVLRKKHVRAPLAKVAGLVLAPTLHAAVAVTRRPPGRLRAGRETDTIPLAEVGEEFDELWCRKRGEHGRLYARRTAEDLRWHFEPRAEEGTVGVLRCRGRGRLEGYAVVIRTEAPDIGLVRAKIADLVVAGDDAAAVEILLAGAYDWGREHGCHILELLGLPDIVRSAAERWRPFYRSLPTYPFFFKSRDERLQRALRLARTWYPTVYDGDTSLV